MQAKDEQIDGRERPHADCLPAAPPLPAMASGRHGWTIVLISIGLVMIGLCVVIPQIDENRQLVYECEKLRVDLDQIEKQVAVNQEFVSRLGRDPAIAERLAQRQMSFIRKGARSMTLEGEADADRSPFSLVNVPPPPPVSEYRPVEGRIAGLCRDPRSRLYMIGAGLMLLAIGLVLGPNIVEAKA